MYEDTLRACGYNGALPRWDWTLDAANVTAGPVWSSDPQVHLHQSHLIILSLPRISSSLNSDTDQLHLIWIRWALEPMEPVLSVILVQA